MSPSTARILLLAEALPQTSKAQTVKHLPTVFEAPHTIEVVDAKETLAGIDVTRSTTVHHEHFSSEDLYRGTSVT